ncbi:hypothetical protein NDU88_004970 [Pleurodeles waltl]|uniref:Uncharacterized protein n=1 Tax=Pleurodeles waltl TaxID=8319 RepID=A0AAV7QHL4_PLEWA|nr:hypothetical protein NDU88_004970 [Pleurodeles waltl]
MAKVAKCGDPAGEPHLAPSCHPNPHLQTESHRRPPPKTLAGSMTAGESLTGHNIPITLPLEYQWHSPKMAALGPCCPTPDTTEPVN